MMQSRWWKAALVAILVVAIPFGVASYFKRDCIDQAGFDRLQIGMTRHEVEMVLGRPPGDYTLGKWALLNFHANAAFYMGWGWEWEEWISDEGAIILTFDKYGRVIEKSFCSMEEMPRRTAREMLSRLKAGLFDQDPPNRPTCLSQ